MMDGKRGRTRDSVSRTLRYPSSVHLLLITYPLYSSIITEEEEEEEQEEAETKQMSECVKDYEGVCQVIYYDYVTTEKEITKIEYVTTTREQQHRILYL